MKEFLHNKDGYTNTKEAIKSTSAIKPYSHTIFNANLKNPTRGQLFRVTLGANRILGIGNGLHDAVGTEPCAPGIDIVFLRRYRFTPVEGLGLFSSLRIVKTPDSIDYD